MCMYFGSLSCILPMACHFVVMQTSGIAHTSIVLLTFNLLFLTIGIQFEQGVQRGSSSSVERS